MNVYGALMADLQREADARHMARIVDSFRAGRDACAIHVPATFGDPGTLDVPHHPNLPRAAHWRT